MAIFLSFPWAKILSALADPLIQENERLENMKKNLQFLFHLYGFFIGASIVLSVTEAFRKI